MTAGLAARRGCGLRGDSGARAGGGDCGARRPPLLRAALARALSDERRTLSDGCPRLMGLRSAEALAPGGAAPRGPTRRSLAAAKLLEGCSCCCGLALAAVAAVGEGGWAAAAGAGSATEPLSELPVGEWGVAARPARTAGTAPVCTRTGRCAAGAPVGAQADVT